MSEEELIRICKQGKPEGQRLLYARYAPYLKGVGIRYLKDINLVSDILHDTFIKIFSNIKKYKGEGAIQAWMRRIMVNACMDHLRKQKKFISELDSVDKFQFAENAADIEEEYSLVEQLLNSGFCLDKLKNILFNIPDKYATVFNLFYIDGLSHKEIARILDINEAMSRKWAFRAKDLIRKEILNQMDIKYIDFIDEKK